MASKKAKDKVKENKEEEAKKDDKGSENGSAKKSQRTTSNVFAMFKQNQIQEFKEAFTMIDADRDGFINKSDLKAIYSSLGRDPTDKECDEMLKECPDPDKLNFTAFLTLFGEKLHGTDPENTILNAFKMFDEDKKGFLEEAYVKDLLMNMGDNMNDNEVRQTWKEAPIEGGKFDYEKFTILMKRGGDEDLQ
jgi:myosin regulatory light chain 12